MFLFRVDCPKGTPEVCVDFDPCEPSPDYLNDVSIYIGEGWKGAAVRKHALPRSNVGNHGRSSDKSDISVVRIASIWALAACQSSLFQFANRYHGSLSW
jgi:hypothetical protein